MGRQVGRPQIFSLSMIPRKQMDGSTMGRRFSLLKQLKWFYVVSLLLVFGVQSIPEHFEMTKLNHAKSPNIYDSWWVFWHKKHSRPMHLGNWCLLVGHRLGWLPQWNGHAWCPGMEITRLACELLLVVWMIFWGKQQELLHETSQPPCSSPCQCIHC